ncbi:MAG: 2-C-methyl-D-erythritol 4-phosphate cytidylyltransferase [Candidatus Omnitrophota bacterium]
MFVSAIIPAAGLGLRLNSRIPKPLVRLNKKPIFLHTVGILSSHPDIKELILVVSADNFNLVNSYIKKNKVAKIRDLVIGGGRRRDSVSNGLKRVSREAEFILVHDAVRPFIELDMISRVIQEAKNCKAAVLGVPVKATVKEIDVTGRVLRTLKRQRLYEIQTPQVFQRDLIINAYQRFPNIAAVDDASLVEKAGNKVSVVLGSYFNIKITTPEDLVFAKAILKYQNNLKL